MEMAGSQVAPGVARLEVLTPTLPPATHTNSYALGERELLLVEPATPYEDEQRQWLAWARALVSQGRQATAVLLTHHHPDHVAGAAPLARELGLPSWAHAATAARLRDGADGLTGGPLHIERLLQDGDTLTLDGPTPQRWQCLHTPGHAPGHLCFVEPQLGIGVVGDMVASVGTILVDPVDGDMTLYLQQLDRLAALGLRTALPAHGDPIAQPEQLFRHYIAHRLARERKVLAALHALTRAEPDAQPSAGAPAVASLDDLVPLAYADTPKMLWPLAKLSLQAHLVKLVRDGVAAARDGGWTAQD